MTVCRRSCLALSSIGFFVQKDGKTKITGWESLMLGGCRKGQVGTTTRDGSGSGDTCVMAEFGAFGGKLESLR